MMRTRGDGDGRVGAAGRAGAADGLRASRTGAAWALVRVFAAVIKACLCVAATVAVCTAMSQLATELSLVIAQSGTASVDAMGVWCAAVGGSFAGSLYLVPREWGAMTTAQHRAGDWLVRTQGRAADAAARAAARRRAAGRPGKEKS